MALAPTQRGAVRDRHVLPAINEESTTLARSLHRRPRHLSLGVGMALTIAIFGPSVPAQAHIDVTMGGTHESRGDGQKAAPCGTAGSQRGDKVYRYRPGATIHISLVETVPHPGYFRIAFDADGDDDFPTPSGTSGERGDCGGDPKCGPGQEDYCSNETVLLDNLDPHAAGEGDRMHTWSVTLPNIECSNCTLQIIQMMDDLNFHPQPFPADDIYYRCIDIELSNDAPEVDDAPLDNDGMVCEGEKGPDPGPAATPDAGPGGPSEGGGGSPETSGDGDDGGCSIASGRTTGLLGPLAVALLALAVRRRSRR